MILSISRIVLSFCDSTTRSRSALSRAPDQSVDPEATDTELLVALWDLVWAGEVTNDTLGPLRAFRKRDGFLLLPLGVYAVFVLAHTLLYMDLMYYYVKLPFLVTFTAESLEGLEGWSLPLPGRPESVSLGTLSGAGLALGCALSTAAILWS